MPISGKSIIGLDFINFLRENYTGMPKDELERMVAEICGLIEFAMDRRNNPQRVMDKIAKTIHKTFEFRSVSIGLKCDDGLYRYTSVIGRTSDEEAALRKLSFNLQDMMDYDKYPNVRLGRAIQYHPVEAFPNDELELKSFGNPPLLDKP
ncbi:MAG: hypothetical protein OEV21_05505, partial [Thermoplasmata archaeon]|nr:hypothetical protein [Thermoplasmata archaeon]